MRNKITAIWREKATWDVRSTLKKLVNHLSYGLRFKSFSPNLQWDYHITNPKECGLFLDCEKKTNEQKNETKWKNEKKGNTRISTYSTNLSNCRCTFRGLYNHIHNKYGWTWTASIQNHNSFTYKARPEKHLPSVQSHKGWMVCTWRSPALLAL